MLRRYPHIKVLALTRNDRKDCVLRLVQAGATGYLLKTVTTDELPVCRAGRGRRQSGAAAHRARGRPARLSPARHDPTAYAPADELTAREREVLKLIAEGNTNQDIADLLCLSRKTVETHRGNIMEKLNLHKVTDLVKYAIREGLTGLESTRAPLRAAPRAKPGTRIRATR